MGQVSFEQFQDLMTTPVVDDQLMKRIRELEEASEGAADLQISKLINGLHFADVGTWATYMGKELIKGDPWDAHDQYEALKDKLNNDFILVELNWAGDPNKPVTHVPDRNVWWNFHGNSFLDDDITWDTRIAWKERSWENRRSGVCLLSELTHDTPLEGSWLTDLWKCMATKGKVALNAELRGLGRSVRYQLLDIMAAILRREAETLGAVHPIWLLGGYNPDRNEEHRLLAQALVGSETDRVICLPHHSGMNWGTDTRRRFSRRRWNQKSLTAMLNEIGEERRRLGLHWDVDAKKKAAAALPVKAQAQ